jgi:5-methylcytosine-specific restriction protein A
MPSRPKGFCSADPRCPERTTGGPCKAHSQQREQRRGSRHARGYTNAWARYSKQRLAQHPWCVGYPNGCHDVPTLADVTDHILSGQARPDLFWEETNHQSLCGACNRRKSIAEEGGFGER